MACKALDGQVAVPADKELNEILDRFVCVRMVQMWGIDLSRFQFDGALTWAIFLMNADGTIYGRYGSRSVLGKESAKDISLEGFKKTLRGALALHSEYRKDAKSLKGALAAKTGSQSVWKTPEAIPDLKKKGRFATRYNGVREQHGRCIHCHMVPTSETLSLRASKKSIPNKNFWPYPMPDEIGLRMDPREVATVHAVKSGSIAERAGLLAGDRLLRLAGQPILSTADIQWVLHNAADSATIAAEIERDDERRVVNVVLEDGWRLRIDEWRFLNVGFQRQVVGFACKPAVGLDRATLGLASNRLALRVQRLPRDLERRNDIRKDDLVVAVDGKRDAMNLGSYTAYLFRSKAPGDTLRLTILRKGKEHTIEVPVR